jgi:putative ABC transport system permease protein
MLSKLKTALRSLLRRSQAESELNEELRYHIEQQTEQNIRLGMNLEEARIAARKAFGGVEQAKERSRDARGVRWIEDALVLERAETEAYFLRQGCCSSVWG